MHAHAAGDKCRHRYGFKINTSECNLPRCRVVFAVSKWLSENIMETSAVSQVAQEFVCAARSGRGIEVPLRPLIIPGPRSERICGSPAGIIKEGKKKNAIVPGSNCKSLN